MPTTENKDYKVAFSLEDEEIKRLKLITKIQIFSFLWLLVAELNLINFILFWTGLLYIIILPLNLILLAIQFKKLLKIGKSKLEVILNLCSSPFIILIIIFWNKYFWHPTPNPLIYKFLSLFGRFGIFLIILSEFIFSIRTLLKINKINNLK